MNFVHEILHYMQRNKERGKKGRKEGREEGKGREGREYKEAESEERKKEEREAGSTFSEFPHLLNGFSHTYSQYVEISSLVEGEIIIIIFPPVCKRGNVCPSCSNSPVSYTHIQSVSYFVEPNVNKFELFSLLGKVFDMSIIDFPVRWE